MFVTLLIHPECLYFETPSPSSDETDLSQEANCVVQITETHTN